MWCYFGSSRPEEAEYLVPEANIRLRPVGKTSLSGAEAEVISVWLESSATLGWSFHLVLFLSISLSPAPFWFTKVHLLLTHPVSSQHVLCHRTHGTTQQGSDSCPPASSHCRHGGTEEESATVGLKERRRHQSAHCSSIQSHFMQIKR